MTTMLDPSRQAAAVPEPRASTGRPWVWLHNSDQPRRHAEHAHGGARCLAPLFVVNLNSLASVYACTRCDGQLHTNLLRVHRLLRGTYSLSGIRLWLTSRNHQLGLYRPIELLMNGFAEAALDEAARVARAWAP